MKTLFPPSDPAREIEFPVSSGRKTMEKYAQVLMSVMVLGLVSLGSLASGGIIFSDSFTYPSGWVIMPALANTSSVCNYWYTDQSDVYTGGGTVAPSLAAFNGQVSRNLRTGGELGSSQFFTSPTLQADLANHWGGDGMYWLTFNVSFLDENNCGYLAEANRSDDLSIFRVDNGVLTSIVSLANGPTGNGRTLTLAKSGSTITFTSTLKNGGATGSVTVSDGTYGNFTKIGIGGAYNGGEIIWINDAALDATVVPEPMTILIMGLGMVLVIRRKEAFPKV